jgi:hypothetical protein
MGTGTVPPGTLVTPAQLSRYNVPADFLAQFEPRPFQIQITTGGALGVMQFAWQWLGDTSGYSAPIVSDAGTSWAHTVDSVFADLTFAAQTYAQNTLYAVDRNGVVTGGTGLTATRFDQRQLACSAVTREAMILMRDAIRPPLMAWDDDATTHAAAWVYEILKRGKGLAPPDAAPGDQNVLTGGEMARKYFEMIGEKGRPDSMVDTSPTVDGPLLPDYPRGDSLRGW